MKIEIDLNINFPQIILDWFSAGITAGEKRVTQPEPKKETTPAPKEEKPKKEEKEKKETKPETKPVTQAEIANNLKVVKGEANGKELTLADVRKDHVDPLLKAGKKDDVVSLIAEYGAANLKELDPKHYPEFIEKLKTL